MSRTGTTQNVVRRASRRQLGSRSLAGSSLSGNGGRALACLVRAPRSSHGRMLSPATCRPDFPALRAQATRSEPGSRGYRGPWWRRGDRPRGTSSRPEAPLPLRGSSASRSRERGVCNTRSLIPSPEIRWIPRSRRDPSTMASHFRRDASSTIPWPRPPAPSRGDPRWRCPPLACAAPCGPPASGRRQASRWGGTRRDRMSSTHVENRHVGSRFAGQSDGEIDRRLPRLELVDRQQQTVPHRHTSMGY